MKNIQLTLIRKWFEMTKSGEKKEDYRDVTRYWFRRLIYFDLESIDDFYTNADIDEAVSRLIKGDLRIIEEFHLSFNPFNINIMTLGYPLSTDKERILKLEHKGIEIRAGNPNWGAEPNKLYFVIKHGEIIK
jgi:hypothetical protein